ncbi:hypothetical protein M885DRAFT_195739 [Pelagophyceae sp. CCMP2097]|nr:hypothetical protein M885DRAFT_195739 [Pelagophyceae sp. CCMP2097]
MRCQRHAADFQSGCERNHPKTRPRVPPHPPSSNRHNISIRTRKGVYEFPKGSRSLYFRRIAKTNSVSLFHSARGPEDPVTGSLRRPQRGKAPKRSGDGPRRRSLSTVRKRPRSDGLPSVPTASAVLTAPAVSKAGLKKKSMSGPEKGPRGAVPDRSSADSRRCGNEYCPLDCNSHRPLQLPVKGPSRCPCGPSRDPKTVPRRPLSTDLGRSLERTQIWTRKRPRDGP